MSIDNARARKQTGTTLGSLIRTRPISALWGGQLRQFILYGVISVMALAADYGLLIFLTEYFGMYYLLSATISFSVGMGLVYLASISVIFKERRVSSASLEFTGFIAIGIAGLVLNGLLLWCITSGTPLSYQLAKLPTAGLVFLFNYFARRELLFTSRSWH